MDSTSNHPAVPNLLTEQLRLLAEADESLTEALSRAESVEAALQCIADASSRTGITLDLEAVRALLAQAEARRQAGVVPLSDEALAEVAGGTVKGSVIFWSVLSLGFMCAVYSVQAHNAGYTCEDSFSGRTPRMGHPVD